MSTCFVQKVQGSMRGGQTLGSRLLGAQDVLFAVWRHWLTGVLFIWLPNAEEEGPACRINESESTEGGPRTSSSISPDFRFLGV